LKQKELGQVTNSGNSNDSEFKYGNFIYIFFFLWYQEGREEKEKKEKKEKYFIENRFQIFFFFERKIIFIKYAHDIQKRVKKKKVFFSNKNVNTFLLFIVIFYQILTNAKWLQNSRKSSIIREIFISFKIHFFSMIICFITKLFAGKLNIFFKLNIF